MTVWFCLKVCRAWQVFQILFVVDNISEIKRSLMKLLGPWWGKNKQTMQQNPIYYSDEMTAFFTASGCRSSMNTRYLFVKLFYFACWGKLVHLREHFELSWASADISNKEPMKLFRIQNFFKSLLLFITRLA